MQLQILFTYFRIPTQKKTLIVIKILRYAFRQRVCFANHAVLILCILRHYDNSFILIEQTTAKIQGGVSKYAKKIEFKEGTTAAFTYIKTGPAGIF